MRHMDRVQHTGASPRAILSAGTRFVAPQAGQPIISVSMVLTSSGRHSALAGAKTPAARMR